MHHIGHVIRGHLFALKQLAIILSVYMKLVGAKPFQDMHDRLLVLLENTGGEITCRKLP